MSAKVYYHKEADQLVLVWPVFQQVGQPSEPVCEGFDIYISAAYVQCGFALEGPIGAVLLKEEDIKRFCVEIGEFDEEQE